MRDSKIRIGVILSASCMTDMPAFYPKQLIEAVETRRKKGVQIHTLVLWTKHPASLLKEPLNSYLTGLRNDGITLVSCPTCGRTHIDLIGLAEQTEKLIADYKNLNIKVAVMGCAVNGPGEAKEAELGIAGGDGVGLIFKKGEILRKVPQEALLGELKKELDNWK